jgi:hypothetical protein
MERRTLPVAPTASSTNKPRPSTGSCPHDGRNPMIKLGVPQVPRRRGRHPGQPPMRTATIHQLIPPVAHNETTEVQSQRQACAPTAGLSMPQESSIGVAATGMRSARYADGKLRL